MCLLYCLLILYGCLFYLSSLLKRSRFLPRYIGVVLFLRALLTRDCPFIVVVVGGGGGGVVVVVAVVIVVVAAIVMVVVLVADDDDDDDILAFIEVLFFSFYLRASNFIVNGGYLLKRN